MTNKLTNSKNNDNWFNVSVTLFVLTTAIGGFAYLYARDTGGMGEGLLKLIIYPSVFFAGILAAVAGFVSFIRYETKRKSSIITLLSILIAISPLITDSVEKYLHDKWHREYLKNLPRSHYLYLLCSEGDILEPERKKKFTTYLNNGANINAITFAGISTTLLGYCLKYNDKPATVDFFLEHGADINLQDKLHNESILYVVLNMGNVKLVEKLLERGAEVTQAHLLRAEYQINATNTYYGSKNLEEQRVRYKKIMVQLKLNSKNRKP